MSAEPSWLRSQPERTTSSRPAWLGDEEPTKEVELAALNVCVLGDKRLAKLLLPEAGEEDVLKLVIGRLDYPKGFDVKANTKLFPSHDIDTAGKISCAKDKGCKIDKAPVLSADVIILLGNPRLLSLFIEKNFTPAEKAQLKSKTVLFDNQHSAELLSGFPNAKPLHLFGEERHKKTALKEKIEEIRRNKATDNQLTAHVNNKSTLPPSLCGRGRGRCTFLLFRNTGLAAGAASAIMGVLMYTHMIPLTTTMVLACAGSAMLCFLCLFIAGLEWNRQRKVKQEASMGIRTHHVQ